MLQRRTRRLAVILEHHHVAQPPIAPEIYGPITEGPEQLLDALLRQLGERKVMVWSLDDHFVGADTVHPVVDTIAFSLEIPLYAQCREFIRHHSQVPAGLIGTGAITISQHLGRCFLLVAGTEGTKAHPFDLDRFAEKVGRPSGALSGNNHPSARNRVFS